MSASSRKRSKDAMAQPIPMRALASSSTGSLSAFPSGTSPPPKRFKPGDSAALSSPSAPVAGTSSSSALGPPITEGLDNGFPKNGESSGTSGQHSKEEVMAMDGFTVVKKDKGKEKKRLKQERAKMADMPQFMYNTEGFKHGKKIGIAHVRDMILHIVTDGTAPSWMMIKHKPSITHTVVIMAPGILPTDLGLNPVHHTTHMPFEITPRSRSADQPTPPPTSLPIMHKLFSHACPTRAPGDQRRMFSSLQQLLQCPLSEKERSKRERAREAAWRKFEDAKRAAGSSGNGNGNGTSGTPDPDVYLLTPNEMLEHGYPLPEWMYLISGDKAYLPTGEASGSDNGKGGRSEDQDDKGEGPSESQRTNYDKAMQNEARVGRGEGWIETPKVEPGAGKSGQLRVVAVDCEMCTTTVAAELTRITLVDYETGKVLLDELVKPSNPITDYLTQYSGITESRLATATHDLSAIQARLFSENLITPYTILLGQSLESDLKAIKLRHPLCIDTAVLYSHGKGSMQKSSLKQLSNKWLNRDIQTGGAAGHDSEEDARACIDLLRMKLVKGPDFGDVAAETESIFGRMARHASGSKEPGRSAAICDVGKTAMFHGQKAKTAVTCKNDDEVTQAVIDNVASHDFLFARWLQLDNARQWSGYVPPASTIGGEDPNTRRASAIAADLPARGEADPPLALAELNDRLTRLHKALPVNTALILLTGNNDPRRAVELNARKNAFDRAYKSIGAEGVRQLKGSERWEPQDERDLMQAVEEARFGMAFFCVK